MIYVLLGVGQLLCSWNSGPNRVRWVLCRIGKVAESLAVVEPLGKGIPILFLCHYIRFNKCTLQFIILLVPSV